MAYSWLLCLIHFYISFVAPLDLPNSSPDDDLPVNSPGDAHSPSSRGSWGKYNIGTDYYKKYPNTGKTREVLSFSSNMRKQ